MANPDVGDVHVNTLLTNVSIGYEPAGFYATKCFPTAPVDKQTDIYAAYKKSFWARDLGAPGAAPTGSYALRRAPGARARLASFDTDLTNTFRCVNYALGFEIPDELKGNADPVFELERDAVTLIKSLLRLRWDREFAADFLATGKWGTDKTISNKWSDYAASTPIEDLRDMKNTLRQKTLGMTAEGGVKLLLGSLTDVRLRDHPDILERIKYSAGSANPAMVTPNLLAQILEVDQVILPQSVYTDSEEGTAEASVTYTDVVSDDAFLFWTPATASRLKPSAGYLFNWRPLTGGGLEFVRRGRQDRERFDWIEVHSYLDWVSTETGAGVFADDAVD